MSGVPKINIVESADELKALLSQQKTALGFAKIQALFLLKIKEIETVEHLSVLVGRHRTTVQRWLAMYRQGGLLLLLEEKKPPGRQKVISEEAESRLIAELNKPEGFSSYQAIQDWLAQELGINASYHGVYKLVRYQLQSKLKIPRPKSHKQEPNSIKNFQDNLAEEIENLITQAAALDIKFEAIRFWCGDETRVGLKTIQRRKITMFGVKPVGSVQWARQSYYIYGLVEPQSGENFFMEFYQADSICFQGFLKLFSLAFPQDLHILQIDGAGFHHYSDLEVPENIILMIQPPYCPEVNPIERLWEYIKNLLSWELPETLEDLQAKVTQIFQEMTQEIVASITGWKWLLKALKTAGI